MELPKSNWEELAYKYRFQLLFLLLGLILIGLGFRLSVGVTETTEIEILERSSSILGEDVSVVVEVSGAVENPGVYSLSGGSRIEDLLIISGGISADADRDWLEKSINRAAKLVDGQKVFIKRVGEQLDGVSANNSTPYQNTSGGQGSGLAEKVNINSASAKELESLWGIGPVYAQNIIEQRPYSDVSELLSRKVIKTNVYERNKEFLTVY